ncbi:hypothetical protein FSP39_000033 [Pinctada imbricata]|uniref:LEM domain-containing protein n=1 Tax=Pinctada imbricata TaxID=66713 RepID=A0AA88Y6M8_PINIB|nr:hypothetical protein FSP39_000033 [Pinctada imbricata]
MNNENFKYLEFILIGFRECEEFLREGADPNVVLALEGVAAMHIAAGIGLEPTRLLLEYGGDPNICSVEGSTPMHVAAIWGNKEALKLLLQNGGDPYLRDQDGMTVLSSASTYEQPGCAKLLEEFSVLQIPECKEPHRFFKTRFDIPSDSFIQMKPITRKSGIYNDMNLDEYLKCQKSENFYMEEINRKMMNCALQNQPVSLDVTSPDHPHFQLKPDPHVYADDTTMLADDLDVCQSLHVHWANGLSGSAPSESAPSESTPSTSALNSSANNSLDTFVTCDSEPQHCSPSLLTGKCVQQAQPNGCINCQRLRENDTTKTSSSTKKVRCHRTKLRESFNLKDNSEGSCKADLPVQPISQSVEESRPINHVNNERLSQSKSDSRWLPPSLPLDESCLISSEGSFLNKGQLSQLITSDESSQDTILVVNDKNEYECFQDGQDLHVEERGGLFNLESLEKMTLEDKICNYLSPDRKININMLRKVDEDNYDENNSVTLKKRISSDSDATVEYIYNDPEKNVVLIEKHLPSDAGSVGRKSLDSILTCETFDSQKTEIYDWRAYLKEGTQKAVVGSEVEDCKKEELPESLKLLSNVEIRDKLRSLGEEPGPITPTTRQTYLIRLSSLEGNPGLVRLTKGKPDYPPELLLALDGKLDTSEAKELEEKMTAAFCNPSKTWREGTLKSSFTYILLDPRVTLNLPNRAIEIGDLECFRTFVGAIFYIGKGKRARPYSHLYEAIKQMENPKDKVSEKVQHILDIWEEGKGVVSLHIFQNVIPVEAYTREAAMVDAIGLPRLSNKKRGDYYGVSTTWRLQQKRKLGVWLLQKALRIFLLEGERQISLPDIKKPK